MTDHVDRKHARLAPSAAERWAACPGSVRMEAGMPEISSRFADEGSAAHELACQCLEDGFDAGRFIGESINGFTVDEEMADAVDEYLTFCRNTIGYGANPDTEFAFEQWASLEWMGVEGLEGGTADFSAYNPETLTLDVVDLKFGRGVFVEPQENKQLLCYALGAARKYHNRGLRKVRLTVVQPRCPAPHGETTRTWEADVLDIFDFESDIRALALATLAPDAPLVPGEHCRFCKAGATCEARRGYALKLAQADFDTFGAIELPAVVDMTSEKLAEVLRHATEIEAWCQRVKEFAHNEAIHGRMPTGFKLVAKRATRKWTNEEEAANELFYKLGLREELYIRKLKSPAQVEPLLPGKNKQIRAALLNGLITKASSGTTLAPEEDPRPAVQGDAAGEFGDDLE